MRIPLKKTKAQNTPMLGGIIDVSGKTEEQKKKSENDKKLEKMLEFFEPTNNGLFLRGQLKSPDYVKNKRGFNLDVQDYQGSISSFSGNLTLYDAVVASDGTGQYNSIQDAINAGKRRIYVRSGTYKLNNNITIPSDCLIAGEDKYTTIIDCNGTNKINISGSSYYKTGTVTVIKGDYTITGSGTSWLANLSVNDYIVVANHVYKITEVTDNTHIEVDTRYEGQSYSGLSYHAGTFKNNVNIKNITITGQSGLTVATGVIYMNYVVNCNLSNIITRDNDRTYGRGIWMWYGFNCDFEDLDCSNNGDQGIILDKCENNKFNNIRCNNNEYVGIYTYYSNSNNFTNIICNCNTYGMIVVGDYNNYTNITTNFNISYGFYLNAVNNGGNVCVGLISRYNDAAGIYLLNTDHNVVANCRIKDNRDGGIIIGDSSYNQIVNNNLSDNCQSANNSYSEIYLYDGANENVISGNIIRQTAVNKSEYNIIEVPDFADVVDYNIITGNIVSGAVTQNIYKTGPNTIKSNNIEI